MGIKTAPTAPTAAKQAAEQATAPAPLTKEQAAIAARYGWDEGKMRRILALSEKEQANVMRKAQTRRHAAAIGSLASATAKEGGIAGKVYGVVRASLADIAKGAIKAAKEQMKESNAEQRAKYSGVGGIISADNVKQAIAVMRANVDAIEQAIIDIIDNGSDRVPATIDPSSCTVRELLLGLLVKGDAQMEQMANGAKLQRWGGLSD